MPETTSECKEIILSRCPNCQQNIEHIWKPDTMSTMSWDKGLRQIHLSRSWMCPKCHMRICKKNSDAIKFLVENQVIPKGN